MNSQQRTRLRVGTKITGTVLVVIALGLGSSWALGPNRELALKREVPLERPIEAARLDIQDPTRWPTWHFDVRQVTRAPAVKASSPLQVGEKISFTVVPKGYSWRKYELRLEVTARDAESVSLKLLEDSSGKMTKLFSEVNWRVSVNPERNSVMGELSARTQHWRSRLYGASVPKIILNQLLLPNLFGLSGHKAQAVIELTPGAN